MEATFFSSWRNRTAAKFQQPVYPTDLFLTAVNYGGPNDLPLLLFDSEAPVKTGHTSWQHLKARDNWDRPNGASDDQAFLMVEVMETWLIADRQMLERYFGANFRSNQIPAWPSLEAVPKKAVLETLDRSTAGCGKKRYAKGKISFELLGRTDPNESRMRVHMRRFYLIASGASGSSYS